MSYFSDATGDESGSPTGGVVQGDQEERQFAQSSRRAVEVRRHVPPHQAAEVQVGGGYCVRELSEQGTHCTGKTGKIAKKNPCQGKHREYLFAQVVNSLILKVKGYFNICCENSLSLFF